MDKTNSARARRWHNLPLRKYTTETRITKKIICKSNIEK